MKSLLTALLVFTFLIIPMGLVQAAPPNFCVTHPTHPKCVTPTPTPNPTPTPVPTPTPIPTGWSEEFTSGMGAFYGDDHNYIDIAVKPAQCTVNNGILSLTAKLVSPGKWETCQALTTRTFDHGYFEARILAPANSAVDAAFWLRKPPSSPTPWNEIDFAEIYPTNVCPGPNKFQSTMHYYSGGVHQYTQYTANNGSPIVGSWHVFGAEWISGQKLQFYMDGVSLPGIGPNPFTTNVLTAEPFNIAFSLGVGSSVWCDNSGTGMPATMQVDWVRWYETKP